MTQKINYPKPIVERKEEVKKPDLDAKKYQKIVESHPAQVIAVSKREKRIEDLIMPGKSETEKKLEKQTLIARVLKAVKKW
jgi:cell division protein YceG involved in septum cleavage